MTVGIDQQSDRQTPKGVVVCPDGSRPRILLAEDSSAARILTTALLTRMGCDVDPVEHGEDAVLHAQSRRYNAIIMDIEMPVMDGVTAAQEIRALGGRAGRTPIVALSAFLADSRKASIWRDSFDINIAKPAGRDQLRQVIQAAVNVADGLPADGELSAKPVPNGQELLDRATLTRLHGEMNGDALQNLFGVVATEIEDCAKRLSEAQADNDVDAVADVAHKLKGIAGTFAAQKLEKLSTTLESNAKLGCRKDLVTRVTETCACADETVAALTSARAVRS